MMIVIMPSKTFALVLTRAFGLEEWQDLQARSVLDSSLSLVISTNHNFKGVVRITVRRQGLSRTSEETADCDKASYRCRLDLGVRYNNLLDEYVTHKETAQRKRVLLTWTGASKPLQVERETQGNLEHEKGQLAYRARP